MLFTTLLFTFFSLGASLWHALIHLSYFSRSIDFSWTFKGLHFGISFSVLPRVTWPLGLLLPVSELQFCFHVEHLRLKTWERHNWLFYVTRKMIENVISEWKIFRRTTGDILVYITKSETYYLPPLATHQGWTPLWFLIQVCNTISFSSDYHTWSSRLEDATRITIGISSAIVPVGRYGQEEWWSKGSGAKFTENQHQGLMIKGSV